ncbi:TetR/AcrR family transcriptional regulator [Bifidobacterium moukalabense]|uniref:TetR family transcriptional regulator n=1 Tax=Bifidobacterium moukalabense DSM 27321 TaxID=1435051 RepID=W4N8Y3_9BIFI|nr:TetR/AcrR family transcriptional regulator [Bifidobacterium moukalabense]ETY71568.1 TetR family transcriptional regulator [Bifidobacterium moukalabense DSM 27321]
MNGKEWQIETSKTKIVDAVFTLLPDNTFDELTLNEILNEAGVSKRTFYRYFKHKDDILEFYYDQFVTRYYQLKDEIIRQTSLKKMMIINLDYFFKNRERLRLLIRDRRHYRLIENFNRVNERMYMGSAVWKRIRADEPDLSLDDMYYFTVGGYSNIIIHRIMEENPKSSSEIADDIFRALGELIKVFQMPNRKRPA